jgi:hypothetical protein
MQAGHAARMAAAGIEEVQASTESRYGLAEAFLPREGHLEGAWPREGASLVLVSW